MNNFSYKEIKTITDEIKRKQRFAAPQEEVASSKETDKERKERNERERLEQEEIDIHLAFIEKGVLENAKEGLDYWECKYDAKHPDTAEDMYPKEFVKKISSAFKARHPRFFVKTSMGSLRKISITWSSSNEV